MNPSALTDSHQACAELARKHYENFPVASWLLPARLRPAVAAIYAFARTADDFADEGEREPRERLALLENYRRQLRRIEDGEHELPPPFDVLRETIDKFRLPLAPFHRLLDAFTQDVIKTRYADYGELAAYCHNSADPIGELVLHLTAGAGERNLAKSDAVCTALQLTNFLQDIGPDWQRGRIYLPRDEMRDFGVAESHIAERRYDANWRRLIEHQIARIERLFETGAPLAGRIPGRVGWEIRLSLAGGRAVLEKLKRQNARQFIGNARLRRFDWVRIALSSLIRRTP